MAGAATCILLIAAPETEASHFRGGTIYATTDDPVNAPLTARIHLIVYYRNDAFGNPQYGWGPVQTPFVGCRSYPAPGAPPSSTPFCGQLGGVEPNGQRLGPICFGDGVCSDWIGRHVYADTLYNSVAYEAWAPGETQPGLPHTYSGSGPWTYSIEGCCRIHPSGNGWLMGQFAGAHYNNPDTGFRIEGRVTLPADQPYKSNMKPIVACNGFCSHSLAATYAPVDATYTARMAYSAETGTNSFHQPGPCGAPCCDPAMTAYVNNGVPPHWEWDSTGACCPEEPDQGFYSTSVQLLGSGTDRSGLEFLVTCNPILLDPPPPPPPPPPQPLPQPTILAFSYAQTSTCGANPVYFADKTVPGAAPLAAWHWDFGDNADSAERSPTHQYGEEGAYKVTLVVTDEIGKLWTRTRMISVAGYIECPTEQQPYEPQKAWEPPRDGVNPALAEMDTDGDGALDGIDNCPRVANHDQADMDDDRLGDACDPDADGDSLQNLTDNCPLVQNLRQTDQDFDASGDACDADRDGDAVLDDLDNCPDAANDQKDTDGDGVGDACVLTASMAATPEGAQVELVRESQGTSLQSRSVPRLAAQVGTALASLAVLLATVLVIATRRRK